MSHLKFEQGYGKAIDRNAFVFYASDGQKRFACYVGREEVADFHRLSGGVDVERHFNLIQAQQCAQASYNAHGLETDHVLLVQLVK